MTWQKGQSGNPKGRPRKDTVAKLEKAIRKVERAKGKKLLAHFVERAFEDDQVLIALARKILPDQKQVEARVTGELELIPMTPIEKLEYEKAAKAIAEAEIQKKLTEGKDE